MTTFASSRVVFLHGYLYLYSSIRNKYLYRHWTLRVTRRDVSGARHQPRREREGAVREGRRPRLGARAFQRVLLLALDVARHARRAAHAHRGERRADVQEAHPAASRAAVPVSTGEYRRVPASTGEYRRVPASAGEYRRGPARTGEDRRVPASAGECRRVPASAGECRRVPASTGESRGVRGESRERLARGFPEQRSRAEE